ncbi:MAG: hypothetical protein PHX43_04020 [Alphaproteobacteria bacterium]|nr:hypothetical protein [Alphaproteobacteria bacterium]
MSAPEQSLPFLSTADLEERKCTLCDKISESDHTSYMGLNAAVCSGICYYLAPLAERLTGVSLDPSKTTAILIFAAGTGLAMLVAGELRNITQNNAFQKAQAELTAMGIEDKCKTCPHYPRARKSLQTQSLNKN